MCFSLGKQMLGELQMCESFSGVVKNLFLNLKYF